MLLNLYGLLLLIMAVAVAIFIKLFQINQIEGPMLRVKLKEQRIVIDTIRGNRGTIFAEQGRVLSASVTKYNIAMDLNVVRRRIPEEEFYQGLDSLAYYLALKVDNSYTPGGWKARLDTAYQYNGEGDKYFLLKNNASYSTMDFVRKLPILRHGQYKGGRIIVPIQKREHPFRMLARRTVGYVKGDSILVGLEGSFNKELKGGVVTVPVLTTKHGRIPLENLEDSSPPSGNDIYTTIDVDLQDIVHNALLRSLNYHDAESGTAILMDVKTGAIKAISNIGKTKRGWAEIYNYAVGTATEPGSTFKLATILALLEDGYVSVDDSIDLHQGKVLFDDEEMVDASAHGLNKTTIRHAFEISSNVGMASLIDKYYNHDRKGPDRFVNRLKDLYLHLPTGIEINGEAMPYIKDPNSKADQWSGITLPWMAIGYEVRLTPLQMLAFYNMVANNGTLVKPYLVTDVKKFGKTIKHFKPTIIDRKVVSSKSLQQVQSLLKGVVERGTAKKLKTDLYSFAGKTGTALMNFKQSRKKKDYQASFVGYFPAENPKYSCIVVVYKPKQHGYYGSSVAGPVFREIADKCHAIDARLKYPLNAHLAKYTASKLPSWQVANAQDVRTVTASLEMPVKDLASGWAALKTFPERDTLFLYDRKMSPKVIPDVRGMTLKDALYILENRGIKVRFKGAGRVVQQSIRGGTPAKGQTIYLRLN